MGYRLHILLAGPPGIAKTILLMGVAGEMSGENRLDLLGSRVYRAVKLTETTYRDKKPPNLFTTHYQT